MVDKINNTEHSKLDTEEQINIKKIRFIDTIISKFNPTSLYNIQVKKKKSNQLSSLIINYNTRYFCVDFQKKVIGYRTNYSDDPLKEEYKISDIKYFNMTISESDYDNIGPYGINICTKYKYLTIFPILKKDFVQIIDAMNFIFGGKVVDINPSAFNSALKLFEVPFLEAIKEEETKFKNKLEKERIDKLRRAEEERMFAIRKAKEEEKRRLAEIEEQMKREKREEERLEAYKKLIKDKKNFNIESSEVGKLSIYDEEIEHILNDAYRKIKYLPDERKLLEDSDPKYYENNQVPAEVIVGPDNKNHILKRNYFERKPAEKKANKIEIVNFEYYNEDGEKLNEQEIKKLISLPEEIRKKVKIYGKNKELLNFTSNLKNNDKSLSTSQIQEDTIIKSAKIGYMLQGQVNIERDSTFIKREYIEKPFIMIPSENELGQLDEQLINLSPIEKNKYKGFMEFVNKKSSNDMTKSIVDEKIITNYVKKSNSGKDTLLNLKDSLYHGRMNNTSIIDNKDNKVSNIEIIKSGNGNTFELNFKNDNFDLSQSFISNNSMIKSVYKKVNTQNMNKYKKLENQHLNIFQPEGPLKIPQKIQLENFNQVDTTKEDILIDSSLLQEKVNYNNYKNNSMIQKPPHQKKQNQYFGVSNSTDFEKAYDNSNKTKVTLGGGLVIIGENSNVNKTNVKAKSKSLIFE